MEIGQRSVRFRMDDGRTCSITRDEPQLRHIDHAYSTTVHGAQGMTSPRVIAVLEAGGRADQDLLYVEISRASEGFELVVDDRELLAERLAERPGIDEGALEAIGADLAVPVVDPDLFAGLQADWRSLRRRADEEDRVLYLAGGYGEVVAQIAALGVIEDLPADMRGFVDTVLEEHTALQQRDDKIRGLAESLGSHWRQWPELCWKASSLGVAPEALDEHRQWRGEGDRLIAQARDLLADRGKDGRHLSAMEGVRSGLESSLAQIENVRIIDDLEIDVPDYPELMRQASTLDERNGAPAKDQETIREWMDTDARWKEARAEVEKFVELVGRFDEKRKEYEAGCAKAGRLLPTPSRLRLGAKQVCRTAERLESRMDAGERNAHIRAAGKDPDSLDSAVREIHNWLARDEVARKMENRGSHIGAEGDAEVQEWWDNQRAAHAGEINDEARTAIAPAVGQLDEAKRRDDTLEVARPKPPSWWKAFIFGTGRYERELAAWEAKRKALFFEVRALEKKYDDLVMLAKPGGLSMAMAEGALRKKHPKLAERVADADKRERVQAQEEREKQWQIGRDQGHDHDIEV